MNNPFIAAYNCGACCGREGGPNARVFARYANDREVSRLLYVRTYVRTWVGRKGCQGLLGSHSALPPTHP